MNLQPKVKLSSEFELQFVWELCYHSTTTTNNNISKAVYTPNCIFQILEHRQATLGGEVYIRYGIYTFMPADGLWTTASLTSANIAINDLSSLYILQRRQQQHHHHQHLKWLQDDDDDFIETPIPTAIRPAKKSCSCYRQHKVGRSSVDVAYIFPPGFLFVLKLKAFAPAKE